MLLGQTSLFHLLLVVLAVALPELLLAELAHVFPPGAARRFSNAYAVFHDASCVNRPIEPRKIRAATLFRLAQFRAE